MLKKNNCTLVPDISKTVIFSRDNGFEESVCPAARAGEQSNDTINGGINYV